jgi:membrane protein implicated in regulation of membrane protease activity
LLAAFSLGHHEVSHGHDIEHDHDLDHEEGGMGWFVSLLTFRSVIAALTFFGLGGLAAREASLPGPLPFVVAVAASVGMLLLVAGLMRSLNRLKDDGTVQIDRTVGKTATVYLSIPGNQTGAGKVTVKVQNRTVEYQAVTQHETLATGTTVQVVAVVNPSTVLVVPVTQAQRFSHV